jgi:beta-phosphoglucomutase-like phosphatase (HAD superfamily)
MALRAVLLDIDGTLLDSNDAHALAWQRALAEQGYTVDFLRIRKLIGMGSDKVVPLLTGLAAEDPRAERLQERRGEIFRCELLPRLRPFPKARELLEGLGRRKVLRGAATSASKDDLKALLERAGVSDLMDTTVSSDDVDRSKPDPDIVAAARRAGVRAIAVRSGRWSDGDLRDAMVIFDDVAALCANLENVLARWE